MQIIWLQIADSLLAKQPVLQHPHLMPNPLRSSGLRYQATMLQSIPVYEV